MLPVSKGRPKILIPYEDKLIIDHIIDSLLPIVDAPEFIFVLSPRNGYLIEEHIQKYYPKLSVGYAIQSEPLGFGHAVLQAQGQVSDEPVTIHASDKVFNFTGFDTNESWMGVRTMDKPIASGVLAVRDGYVTNIIEKPCTTWSAICYIRETKLLFDCLQRCVETEYLTVGEYQITDALDRLVREGVSIKATPISYIYRG